MPRAWYLDTGAFIVLYNLQTAYIMNGAITFLHVPFYRKRQLRPSIKVEGSILVPVRFITAMSEEAEVPS